MKLIAAVDENWGIGCKGKLLTSIPNDMKFFRETTRETTVIMGRVTLDSFPEGKPLKNRTNIVLTRNKDFKREGVIVVHSIDEALSEAGKAGNDVFVIGGENIYKAFLPYCDKALITKIDYKYEADAFFPNLDEDPDWEVESESEEAVYFDLIYRFLTYKRTGNV